MKTDVIVLGAGIVGVSAALALQARGRSVALIERRGEAGLETSYGNGGLIERASVSLLAFPRDFGAIKKTLLGRSHAARIDWRAAFQIAPWIAHYYYESAPARAAIHAWSAIPLIERSVSEHRPLAEAAQATHLLRSTGWIKAFRTPKGLERGLKDAEKAHVHHLRYDFLDRETLKRREPSLSGFCGAVHYRDPIFVSDPGGLVAAYAALFQNRGGLFLTGDARSLEETGHGWRVLTEKGTADAREAVIALGPWSNDLYVRFGYEFPLGFKRGYHMHYGPSGDAALTHPVLDAEEGFLLAPMRAGLRLTTGAEFSMRDAPPSARQIDAAEKAARAVFPLGERIDPRPWLGARPCLPDLLPVLGPAPRHGGLWFDFGHQHHGLTLGPATGRLLAEMMCGETPFTDPAPYSAERF